MPTAAKNVKYHSSPQREGRSTVESAIKNVDLQEENIGDISKKVYDFSEIMYAILILPLFYLAFFSILCTFVQCLTKSLRSL